MTTRTTNALSDEVLAQRAADLNDTAAFAELVRRHQRKVLLLQRRLVGEPALAEDLAQETFIRAWEKLDTYRGSGSFGGWLASLGYNVFRAHWRKHRHHRNEIPVAETAPLVAHGSDEAVADLDRLLLLLDHDDRVILILSYAFGLSNTEVAEALDMPPGTVKARIHRAKARIRDRIEASAPDAGQPLTCPAPLSRSAARRAQVPSASRLTRAVTAALGGRLKGAYRL